MQGCSYIMEYMEEVQQLHRLLQITYQAAYPVKKMMCIVGLNLKEKIMNHMNLIKWQD